MRRIMAIDIGSNAVRCLVAEAGPSDRLRVLRDKRTQTRLGVSVDEAGRIAQAAADATVAALAEMLALAASLDVGAVHAVATAAVRDAPNGADFVARIRAELGLAVDVISAEEEARLVFLSAAHDFELGPHAAVFDLGGGSLELVRSTGGAIEAIRSLRLGAVVLTQRFIREDPPSAETVAALAALAREAIAGGLGGADTPVNELVGSGGTMNAIGAITAKARGLRRRESHGMEVERGEVAWLLESVRAADAHQRAAIRGMPRHRVDIILAGLVVVDALMTALSAEVLRVNTRGLREGIVIGEMRRLEAATGQ